MEVLIRILFVGFATIQVTCFENLAQMTQYKGQASQSSAYPNQTWTADKAVDGQLQQDTVDDLSSCSITRDWMFTVAWWKFPLKETANVAYLEIHFRKSTVNRHVGFSVFVFDDPNFIPTSSLPNKVFTQAATPCPTRVLNVTVNRATRGIALFNTKNPPVNTSCEGYRYLHLYTTIEVCEVRVMGCPYGYFGENCLRCGLCQDGLCDVYNGTCIQGCNTHVMEPPLCADCRDGLYGKNCTQTCGNCQTGTYCDDITGICPEGCQDHWSGSNCDVPSTTIIISLLSTLLVVAVVIIVIILRRNRECHRPQTNIELNTTGSGSQMEIPDGVVHQYVEVNATGNVHAYDQIDHLNDSPSSEINTYQNTDIMIF